MNTDRMPVVFAGHGSPMNAIGDNRARQGWRAVGEHIVENYGKPSAILAVFDGTPGGTMYTLNYAMKEQLDILLLDLNHITAHHHSGKAALGYILCFVNGNHFALTHNTNPVGNGHNLIKFMGNDDD